MGFVSYWIYQAQIEQLFSPKIIEKVREALLVWGIIHKSFLQDILFALFSAHCKSIHQKFSNCFSTHVFGCAIIAILSGHPLRFLDQVRDQIRAAHQYPRSLPFRSVSYNSSAYGNADCSRFLFLLFLYLFLRRLGFENWSHSICSSRTIVLDD